MTNDKDFIHIYDRRQKDYLLQCNCRLYDSWINRNTNSQLWLFKRVECEQYLENWKNKN